MAGRGRPRKPGAKAAKGYKLPEPIPEGHVIQDVIKKSWVIRDKIGSGGFGTVYFASENGKTDCNYVIKVEYHGNGPLFAEMHCYQNIGKPSHISEWIKKRKIPYLGLSPFYGSGSFEYQGDKYRFMVIERYGKDLQKLLDENQKRFPLQTVYQIGLHLINVLEYIHVSGYIHGDIKAANLLLGRNKETENQVYLVDMGLACKYMKDNVHVKEAPNPKKAHNGTPEFTSRDAHRGCFSRRSDFEVLCFNMLQWLSGELPWEKYISDNIKLQKEKEKFMADIEEFLNVLFSDEPCPAGMKKLLTYISGLSFEDEPDYNLCRKFISDDLKKLGCTTDVLSFKKQTKQKRDASSSRLVKSTKALSNKENTEKPKPPTKKTQSKRKSDNAEIVLVDGVVPTPAMLEVMRKKAEAPIKPVKTRKKENGVVPTPQMVEVQKKTEARSTRALRKKE